jgi:outer membrane protein assembly factor BamB
VTTIGDRKVIVFVSDKSLAAVGATDGKTLWKTNYEQGRYNAATPVVEGQTLIYAGPGRGTTAVSLEPEAAALAVRELWSNPDNSLMYNSPVLKDGLLFGLSNSDNLFCINAENGQTVWSVTASGEPASAQGNREEQAQPGQGQRRRRRGGGGGGGYGSIVDVGSPLLALTPNGQLTVYAPDGGSFQKLASYKVAESGTYAYPIAAGNRIYVKDQNSVTLWTID